VTASDAYEHTNVIRIELIHADENAKSGRTQSPGSERSENGEFTLVNIVDQERVELLQNPPAHLFVVNLTTSRYRRRQRTPI
jgi:hypothetical protein